MTKARILIVEDEAIIAMEIESCLQDLGYEVTSIVNSGDAAIKQTEEEKPDLILMDIRIQGDKDGIEAAEIIRSRFGIPVVFSTAYLDEERIERAKITMPFGYLLKPIQERDLKVALEMALYVAKADAKRRELEASLKEYEKVVEGSKDIIVVIDENYRYVLVNESFLTYNRLNKEDVIGQHVADVLGHEVFEASIRSYVDRAFKGEVVEFNMSRQYVQLGERQLHVSYFPVRPEPGKKARIAAIIKDITDSRNTAEALRESEAKFRSYVENAPDGIFIVDDTGKYLEVNNAASRITGYSKDELLTKSIIDLIPSEDHDLASQHFKTLRDTGQSTGELKYRQKDGTVKHWMVDAVKLSENRFIGFTKDVTEKKEAEALLIERETRIKD